MRFSINHNDTEALRRIINYPSRKIGDKTIEKLFEYSAFSNKSVWEIMTNLHSPNINLNAGTKQKLSSFAQIIQDFSQKAEELDAYEFATHLVYTSGIHSDLFSDKTPEGVSRYQNMQELQNGIKIFCTQKEQIFESNKITDYLEEVSLLADINNKENEETNIVSLMTIHSAKGLEFTNVMLVGLEENLFPSASANYSVEELEEERRLFYVALTRAKDNLVISYANQRFKFGKIQLSPPSRFLEEIHESFIEWNSRPTRKYHNSSFEDELEKYNHFSKNPHANNFEKREIKTSEYKKPRKLVSINETQTIPNHATGNIPSITQGDKVAHTSFGKGEVVEIIGVHDNTKAVVLFDSGEKKTLLLKYAKLQIIQ